jgi:basic membrane protein A and related proteins
MAFKMNRRTRSGAWAAAMGMFVLSLAVLAGCSQPKPADGSRTDANDFGIKKNSGKLEVGFVTVGPVSDWGYNYQHNQGRLGMEARLRDSVHTVLAENVPETADVERVMERMANSGAGLIYATSYGYAASTKSVAAKYPNTIFMQALGSETGSNLGTCSLRVWEPAYVCGVVAALTMGGETHFGFVGAQPVPPIFWTVNAFARGARSVNPKVTVRLVFTNSWYDPAAETEAVNSLASQGVKVVYVLTDSPIAGVQAAEKAGIHSLAHFADLSSFAPRGWITGSVWQWSRLYEDVTKRVMEKTWKPDQYGGGFAEGYVALAPFGPSVPNNAQEKARQTIEAIKSGKLAVFGGPIKDNTGRERVPAGQALDIGAILGMDWAVEGVEMAGTPTAAR